MFYKAAWNFTFILIFAHVSSLIFLYIISKIFIIIIIKYFEDSEVQINHYTSILSQIMLIVHF